MEPAEQTEPSRGMLRPFGRSALALAIGGWVIALVLLAVDRGEPEPAWKDGQLTYFSFALLMPPAVLSLAQLGAVILGGLSLFGLGKSDGQSRPVLGAIGAGIGVFTIVVVITLFHSVSALRTLLIEEARKEARTMESPKTIVNHEAGFQLSLPGDGWKLHGPNETRKVNPIACALALSDEVGGYIITENAAAIDTSQASLQELMRRYVDSRPMEGKRMGPIRSVTFQGVPSVRGEMTALVEGERGRWTYLLIPHGPTLIQLVHFGPEDEGLRAGFKPHIFFDAVRLLPLGENGETPKAQD